MTAPHSLIIGGTRGIGRETVEHFLRQGHNVSVIARRPPDTKMRNAHARYWTADICDKAIGVTLGHLAKEIGRPNYLVFFQRYRGTDDDWQGEIDTSLSATRRVIEELKNKFADGDKSIVIVSSINAALIAGHLPLGYHMAKAGLCQMVRYWAVTLGPSGFRVNSVSPGTVLKEHSKEFFLKNKPLCQLYERITPLRRFGHASEVAQVIGILCSSQTSFVTGQDIIVDGGVSLQWQESLARELLDLANTDTPPKR